MLVVVGIITILVSSIGSFAALGGQFHILIQPFEVIMICGIALGAYMVSNRAHILKGTVSGVLRIFGSRRYNKDSYLELLSLLYTAFKLSKTKGMLALEQHVDNPKNSALFSRFPGIVEDAGSLVFLCDYLRLLTLGTDNPHEVEALMDEEIETHHMESLLVPNALQTMADGLPAVGICGAVLGVITTMGYISGSASVIGEHIGGALVGTLLGVLLAYGFVGPIASSLKQDVDAEVKFLQCMKGGILAHMQGYAPAVSVEFARKTLLSDVRPTFYEVETAVSSLPPI